LFNYRPSIRLFCGLSPSFLATDMRKEMVVTYRKVFTVAQPNGVHDLFISYPVDLVNLLWLASDQVRTDTEKYDDDRIRKYRY
jgi:hypothetical protein